MSGNRNSQEKTNKTHGASMECGTGKRGEIQSNFTVDKPANTILGYHYHESQGHLQHAMKMAHYL